MPLYRLYFLNLKGRTQRSLTLECVDDEEAIEAIREHPHEYKMELWCGRRFVKGFPPGKR